LLFTCCRNYLIRPRKKAELTEGFQNKPAYNTSTNRPCYLYATWYSGVILRADWLHGRSLHTAAEQ